jgi:hydroxymethylglutaryl-CoA lyase
MTTAQAMSVCKEVIAQGRADNIEMLAYVATAWECPFDGIVDEAAVIDLVTQFYEAGASAIILADTIGAANPASVKSLTEKLVKRFGANRLSCHFHDTRAMGLVNIYAAIESGIRKFDSSIGGLGGCPFSPGASGNVATEDVVLMLEQMGFETGINLKALIAAAELAAQLTETNARGKSQPWLKRQIKHNKL